MPTARALVRVNGGPPRHGGVEVPAGALIQLVAESTAGWRKQRWEIYSYPPGFQVPAGWSADADETIFATDPRPASFDIPPAGSGIWGKWFFRLRIDGAVDASDPDPSLIDEGSAVSVLSPNGFEDVGWLEEAQFGGKYGWVRGLARALRAVDRYIGTGSVASAAGGDLGGNYPAPRVERITGLADRIRLLAGRLVWDASLKEVGAGQAQASSGGGTIRVERTQAAAQGSGARGGDLQLALGRSDGAAPSPSLRVAYEDAPGGVARDALVVRPDGQRGSVLSSGGGSLGFGTPSGAVRARLDPVDETLRVSTPILGDPAARDPLRLGFARVPITSTRLILPPEAFACQVLEVFGLLTGPTVVELPNVAGYAKLFSNQTSGPHPLQIMAMGSGSGVFVPQRHQEWIFCDGTAIRKEKTNRLVDAKSAELAHPTYLNPEASTRSTTFVDVPGLAVTFEHAAQADLLDVSLRLALGAAGAVGEARLLLIEAGTEIPKHACAARSENTTLLHHASALHVVSTAGPLAVRVQARMSGGQGNVSVHSPSALVARLIRY